MEGSRKIVSSDIAKVVGKLSEKIAGMSSVSEKPAGLIRRRLPEVARAEDNPEMAAEAEFSILTYQRQPGRWRALVGRVDKRSFVVRGTVVKTFVTFEDSANESDAEHEAMKEILKIR